MQRRNLKSCTVSMLIKQYCRQIYVPNKSANNFSVLWMTQKLGKRISLRHYTKTTGTLTVKKILSCSHQSYQVQFSTRARTFQDCAYVSFFDSRAFLKDMRALTKLTRELSSGFSTRFQTKVDGKIKFRWRDIKSGTISYNGCRIPKVYTGSPASQAVGRVP